jgi:integrase
VFSDDSGGLLRKNYLRLPLEHVVKRVGIKRRFTVHGFRRTFNNIARQVAGEIVTRSITGHVTQAMTEHYSHVGREEKLAAAGSVVRLVFAAKMGASGGSGGGEPDPNDPSVQR